MSAGAVLFSEMTPDVAWAEDFHKWYNEHHIPIRMAAPGFTGAQRYADAEGPGFLAVYDMDNSGALRTPEYGKIKGEPSEQTAWMLKNVAGFTRYIGTQIGLQLQEGVDEAAMLQAPVLYAVMFDVPEDRLADFDEWYDVDHVPLLLGCKDWLGCRRYALEDSHPHQFNRMALHYLADASALQSDARAAARASAWRDRIAAEPWFKGKYLIFNAIGQRFASKGSQA